MCAGRLGRLNLRKEIKGHRMRTRVCPVMRFEVGALRVGFPTAYVVARVRGDPLPWPGAPAAFRLGFLCQAVPAGDHEGLCGIESRSQHRGNIREGRRVKNETPRPGNLIENSPNVYYDGV